MIDKEHALPLTRQVKLLQLSRGCADYVPAPTSDADLELMREIDKLHLEYPFAGARMLRDFLKQRGYRVGRRHVGRLMDLMGIEALYRKKRGTKRNPAHPVYPYLLRNLVIDRPNQVRCADTFVHPDGSGLSLSLRSAGLAFAQRAGLAALEQPHNRLLHRCRRGSNRGVRLSRRSSTPTKTRSAGYNVYGFTTLSHL